MQKNFFLMGFSKDQTGDWHTVFAEAAFEHFKMDTFSGKKYLEYVIEAWKWMTEQRLDEAQYKKKYELCKRMYKRCYPE